MAKNKQKKNRNGNSPTQTQSGIPPQQTSQPVDYKSGKAFCELCKSEYDSERNRTSVIDSKANIVLSFSAVFFVALTQAINLAKLLQIEIKAIGTLILPILALILIVGSLAIALTAIIMFACVICTHTYNIIDPAQFYDDDILTAEPNDFAITLALSYKSATENNCNVNTKRTVLYNKGLILLIVSIGLFALYMCLISFI